MKMVYVFLNLLLLVHFPRTFASESIQSSACGNFRASVSRDLGHDLFYINGKIASKDLFCKSLKFYQENHCFGSRNIRNQFCRFDHSSGGRKLLQNAVRRGSAGDKKEVEDHENSIIAHKYLVVGIPGIFVLCCAFLCPCFRSTKKETAHTVLSKEPVSADSSFEMKSVSERHPGSPQRVPPSPSRFYMSPKLSRLGSVHLNMSEVARLTKNFSPSMRVGEGGFGSVYKAKLPNGQFVAIKRARKEHFESLRSEFKSEVELLTKIEHRSLVKLLGFIDKGDERLIITEFVPNGTLRSHLDGLRGNYLDFNQRLEIAIDVASGLTYLHLYAEKQIIHRDVKSSNILLTESKRAKVADFGFARLGETGGVVTEVKGTVGYLDPEYMKTRQLTHKSDVYSFGILLLEILTGRRPVELHNPDDERVTVRWAFKKYNEGKVAEMIDPHMKEEQIDVDILEEIFDLAIQCAAPTRADRPDMETVGKRLWGIRINYLKTVRRSL